MSGKQNLLSVSGAAVEYVKEVFDHFGDKTVLVIGAGKMGELTLRHLRALQPGPMLLNKPEPRGRRSRDDGLRAAAAKPCCVISSSMRRLAPAAVVLSSAGAITEPITGAHPLPYRTRPGA